MFFIKAVVTKLLDDSVYPEIVLCEFIDYFGKKQVFIEKWPVVSNEKFTKHFPLKCYIGCKIIKENMNSYLVSTLEPYDIESEDGLFEFEISKEMLYEERR